MIHYLRARLGEKTTAWGGLASLCMIVGSFFVPAERADIANVMQGISIPIFVGLFLWKDEK